MKKNLFFGLLLAVQSTFAQIISKDPSFASNGNYSMPATPNGMNNYYISRMIQNSDGSIYFSY
jgi:hypothetical protein